MCDARVERESYDLSCCSHSLPAALLRSPSRSYAHHWSFRKFWDREKWIIFFFYKFSLSPLFPPIPFLFSFSTSLLLSPHHRSPKCMPICLLSSRVLSLATGLLSLSPQPPFHYASATWRRPNCHGRRHTRVTCDVTPLLILLFDWCLIRVSVGLLSLV